MDQGIRPLRAEDRVHQRTVANISVGELVALAARYGLQILEVAGVRELVQIDDTIVSFSDQEAYERRTDEAGAACNKDFHDVSVRRNAFRSYLFCVSQS